MARTRKALPAQVDVAHLISAGVLASVCPRALIEEVLADTSKASQRERLLPAPAVVYYVMALALWREAPLEEVLRVVCEGLQWLGGGEAGAVQASKSAISQARARLGSEVMRRLADRVLRPLAEPGASGAWCRHLRVMALDGSCMDVADEAANAEVRIQGVRDPATPRPTPPARQRRDQSGWVGTASLHAADGDQPLSAALGSRLGGAVLSIQAVTA
jgi:hypothetical protein